MHGGFVFVRTGDGRIVRSTARGRLKHRSLDLLVGDRVRIAFSPAGAAVVEEVLARRTQLLRPPMANADLAVLVQAVCEPAPSLVFLDRLLIQAQAAGLSVVIVWNKADLDPGRAAGLAAIYRAAGFDTWTASAVTGEGIAELVRVMTGRLSVFAGPSGVGKTSLLNAVIEGAELTTQAVSARNRRGRHTTRLTQLLPLKGGGLVADTPGFTSLRLPSMKTEELRNYYPEFVPLAGLCCFRGCRHDREPSCAVKEAVAAGRIDPGRYERYRQFLAELDQVKEPRKSGADKDE